MGRESLKYTVIRAFDRKASAMAKVDLEKRAIVLHTADHTLIGEEDLILMVRDTESGAINDEVYFKVHVAPSKESPISLKKTSPIFEQFSYENDDFRIGGEAGSQIHQENQSSGEGENVVNYSF